MKYNRDTSKKSISKQPEKIEQYPSIARKVDLLGCDDRVSLLKNIERGEEDREKALGTNRKVGICEGREDKK